MRFRQAVVVAIFAATAVTAAAACGKAREAAPVATTARPADAASADVWVGWDPATRVFRAPGGTATLTLPPLGGEWAVERDRAGVLPLLTVFLGTREHWRGYVSFLFYPRADVPAMGPDWPAAIVQQQATELVRGTPFLAPVDQTGEAFVLPGGTGYSVQLTGTNQQGIQEVLNVIAVADGTAVVGVIFRGTVAEMSGGKLEQIASPLLAGLAVGRHVGAAAARGGAFDGGP